MTALPLPAESSRDHRGSPREPYQYTQRIAPMFAGKSPTPDRFFEVACGDLSAGGFSFYLNGRPEFEHLVVALGPRSQVTHLVARVVYVEETPGDAQGAYRIGCRFTERIHSSR